ncbi:TPA: phage tail sheath subtilisin-like domain-containing protein [Clostridioides difficile]|nr:phage tail sheath subtilisin-like domain-containing protein [Clostridioides difficile]HBF6159565.1 phage tail sheath subtilisin-like domain-containing protein [Clostridioides difficile]HBF8116212.1 phage tail sheath subtilisin-like domain-containing protein [Clostridioides difficile]
MAGLVNINIEFKELATSFIQRSRTRIVAIILKDTTKMYKELTSEEDIPSSLTDDNKKYIKYSFIGSTDNEKVLKPSKVIITTIPADGKLEDILSELESVEFNYLCMPESEEAEKTKIVNWIKKIREEESTEAKAVLANIKADNEAIINFTEKVTVGGEEITAEKYTPRIASLIASTPNTQSVTYAPLDEVESIVKIDKASADAKVKAGELILRRLSGKIRIARGVNSLTTLTAEKGEMFQKIKLVDTKDLISKDIKNIYVEKYLRQCPNTYDNKCLFIVAVQSYLTELAKQELIDSNFTIEIDIEKQKEYLESKKVDTSKMNDNEIKNYSTGSNGFYLINLKLVDAMEDINIRVQI